MAQPVESYLQVEDMKRFFDVLKILSSYILGISLMYDVYVKVACYTFHTPVDLFRLILEVHFLT